MIVYHGSNSNFRKLKISKSLVKHTSTLGNEGLGIYFSTDPSVANSYGKYLYTLEINDRAFIDMRKKVNCTKYIRKIIGAVYKETGVNIGMYFDFQSTIDRLYYGGQAVFSVGHDIAEVLDNTDEFYDSGLSQTKKSNVYRVLRRMDKECPKAYMFNYHIKNIGVIKDVSEEYVRIIKRENIGFGVISG